MLREYIEDLVDSNRTELERLEKQMNRLMEEQKCSREWIENLQREQNVERNIFSPRSQAAATMEKLDAARKNIGEINRKIEQTRERIGDAKRKQEEYRKLLTETDKKEKGQQTEELAATASSTEMPKVLSAAEAEKLLSDLYQRTELCMALLNGDKNKCKNELRSLKNQIKKYAEEFQN